MVAKFLSTPSFLRPTRAFVTPLRCGKLPGVALDPLGSINYPRTAGALPRRKREEGMENLPTHYNGGLATVQDFFGLTATSWEAAAPQGPHNPREFAQRLYAFEALYPPVSHRKLEEEPEPYSL